MDTTPSDVEYREVLEAACLARGIDTMLDPGTLLGELLQHERAQEREKLKSVSTKDSEGTSLTVASSLYWRYPQVDLPPHGSKIFLLNAGGAAITPGPWFKGNIAWHPLFKRDTELERKLGITR